MQTRTLIFSRSQKKGKEMEILLEEQGDGGTGRPLFFAVQGKKGKGRLVEEGRGNWVPKGTAS